jgi:hypothetical protein
MAENKQVLKIKDEIRKICECIDHFNKMLSEEKKCLEEEKEIRDKININETIEIVEELISDQKALLLKEKLKLAAAENELKRLEAQVDVAEKEVSDSSDVT